MTIIDEYLFHQVNYTKKYGKKTVVLMQVGSFYEMYSTDTTGPDLTEISYILNIMKTKKDKGKEVGPKNPYMMGFPTAALQKFLKVLIDNTFTVVRIDQVTPPPEPKRKVVKIYSVGTSLESSSADSNCIVSVYIEDELQSDNTVLVCVGLSVVDLSTGKSSVHEAYGVSSDDKISLDEATRFINDNQPKEILVFRTSPERKFRKSNTKYMSKEALIQYLELDGKQYHYFNTVNKSFNKLSYQTDFFAKIFPDHGMLQPVEYVGMEMMNYARMSYICLLDFAYQHDNEIVNNIEKPEVFQNNKHLILGNNAASQLNIFESDSFVGYSKRFRSLFDVVNNTSTAIGRRCLKATLISPLTSSKELKARYNQVEVMINDKLYEKIEMNLKCVPDLERLHRKISLNICQPWEMVSIISGHEQVYALIKLVKKHDELDKLLPTKKIVGQFKRLIKRCSETFDTEAMKTCLLNDISVNLFLPGFDTEIDSVQVDIDTAKSFINRLCSKLSEHVADKNKKINNDKQTIYLKSTDQEKEGCFLELTGLRAATLQKNLKTVPTIKIDDKHTIKTKDLVFTKIKNGKVKITLNKLTEESIKVHKLTSKLSEAVREKYSSVLSKMYENNRVLFRCLVDFIASVDFIKSAAKTAKLYNYCKPTVVANKTKSYVNTVQIRHPIIERINDQVEYVPHDVDLGGEIDGMLVYGVNSSGKSSMMKGLGLSVVMAQCGMFVPASEFTFVPFFSMFARITASDNIFKGLSSFALEMVELRAILKRSDSRTLVIGDEVCRGTEQISGNALVASTLITLAKSDACFIFATHLHEIAKMDRIKKLKNVKAFHLSVEYDEDKDVLVFDRTLKPGSGSDVYGITVARYLIHDNDFIRLAQEIKNEMTGGSQEILKSKKSRYNSKVLMDKCGVCGERGSFNRYETHHINFQKDCEDGFVKKKPHVKMNSRSNLVPLCEECHDKVHDGEIEIKGYKDTSKGFKLVVV